MHEWMLSKAGVRGLSTDPGDSGDVSSIATEVDITVV
jgi:hypothetical protein